MASDVFGILRPAIHGPQKTIVVLGAPRGGTSMVAATLRKLGIMMGERLGHQHEDPLFRKAVPLEEKVRTVERRNREHDVWGWKLPNSVYDLEELLPHLRNPHFVAIFRNPYSISRSSAERDGRDYDAHVLEVAVNHTKMVIDLVARLESPTALASFESAIKDPTKFTQGLADFIGVGGDEGLVASAAQQGVNTKLNYLKF